MLSKEKIRNAVDFIYKKHGGVRPASRATKINVKSLSDYFDGVSEPRNKNLGIIARAVHKPASYFFEDEAESFTGAPAPVPEPSSSPMPNSSPYSTMINSIREDVEFVLNSGDMVPDHARDLVEVSQFLLGTPEDCQWAWDIHNKSSYLALMLVKKNGEGLFAQNSCDNGQSAGVTSSGKVDRHDSQ